MPARAPLLDLPVHEGVARIARGYLGDAAAALVACNELWEAGLSVAELTEIAAQLGSDVPFALVGGTAIGLGRGERLTTALVSGSYHWVLAFGATGLSTPDVYAACDRLRAARAGTDIGSVAAAPELSTGLMAALRSGNPAAVGPLLSNDLQPAALSLQPLLRRALAAGHTLHGRRALPTRSMHKNGGRLYVELSFSVVKNAQGAVIGAMAIGRDITARYLKSKDQWPHLEALEAWGTIRTAACPFPPCHSGRSQIDRQDDMRGIVRRKR